MQSIILATDEQPSKLLFAENTPAPLVPVLDRPVMATTVEILSRAGQKRVLVSLFNRGGPIAAYFGGGKRWGVDIEYLTQREGWGSAGALKWAARLLNETFLVLPGDSVIDLDIEAALDYHRTHGAPATAILHYPAGDDRAPIVNVVADGSVSAVGGDGPNYARLAATGAFILEPSVLRYIPNRTHFDIIDDLIPALLAAGEQVYGYEMSGYWNALDNLQSFQEAQQVFLYSAYTKSVIEGLDDGPAGRVRFPSITGRQVAPGIWVGLNDSIHPTVKVAAPVYIGTNTWIGSEVELGSGSVIGSGVVIDEEATVSRSTILSETYVGRLVKIEDRIINASTIIDPDSGDAIEVVDPFLLSKVGTRSNTSNPLRRVAGALGAALLLLVFSPLIILAGLLAFMGSPTRWLVRSTRVGQHLEDGVGNKFFTFELLNFRTRKDAGGYTLFGRLLERLEFQRLPELFNVLRGDMALIGVKPLTPTEAAQLTEEWHQKRNEVRAGFTGLWYQQTDVSSDLDTVLVTDVYYSATRTWRGDVLILLRTPIAWLRRCTAANTRNNSSDLLVQTDNVGSM